MPEELEERRSEGTDLNHLRDIVRRRHLYFLIPLFVAWLLVWGASWLIPPRYKSSTLILVAAAHHAAGLRRAEYQ